MPVFSNGLSHQCGLAITPHTPEGVSTQAAMRIASGKLGPDQWMIFQQPLDHIRNCSVIIGGEFFDCLFNFRG
jgi:hypothetical protein